jgi:DNA-binding NarL/FixJ family response regulator
MKRVVVIEDQVAVSQLLTRVIEMEEDFRVVGYSPNGEEGVALIDREKPDLIILDVMLPDINGTEVLRRITHRHPKTRILVFSGYVSPVLVRELLQAGAHGYVEKTAPIEELTVGLRKVLREGGSHFGPAVAKVLRQTMNDPDIAEAPTLDVLTRREKQILRLIAESNSTKEVATQLQISVKTAENHRTNLMKKLNLHDVASLTRFAIERGLVNLHS